MTKQTKSVLTLAIAVMIGIWLYRKFSGGLSKTSIKNIGDQFEGPDIDQKTGAYLPAGVSSGTVEFSAQGN